MPARPFSTFCQPLPPARFLPRSSDCYLPLPPLIAPVAFAAQSFSCNPSANAGVWQPRGCDVLVLHGGCAALKLKRRGLGQPGYRLTFSSGSSEVGVRTRSTSAICANATQTYVVITL